MPRRIPLAVAAAALGAAALAAPTHGQDEPAVTHPPRVAGTVTGFEDGVLTIRLSDGEDRISGHVVRRTRIRCRWAPAPGAASAQDRPAPRPGSDARPTERPPTVAPHRPAPRPEPGDREPADPQPADPEPRPTDPVDPAHRRCGPRLLRPGTPVLRATLVLIPRGAVWKHLAIVVRRPVRPAADPARAR